MWGLLFQRLQSARTPKFVRGFLLFLAGFILRHGASATAASIDAVQGGLFTGGVLAQARACLYWRGSVPLFALGCIHTGRFAPFQPLFPQGMRFSFLSFGMKLMGSMPKPCSVSRNGTEWRVLRSQCEYGLISSPSKSSG